MASRTHRAESVRYFTYISDAKVDLLFDQIPRKLLSRFAADFAVDLKLVSVSVRSTQSQDTRFGRLRMVERHIDEDHDVGSVARAAPWFRGELGLRSGIHRDGLVLFTGLDDDTLVALIGSSHHLIGGRSAEPAEIQHVNSQLPALFGLLERDESEREHFRSLIDEAARRWGPGEEADDEADLGQLVSFAERLRGPRQPCGFLARRLLHGTTTDPAGRSVKVLIGTPLYVELADR